VRLFFSEHKELWRPSSDHAMKSSSSMTEVVPDGVFAPTVFKSPLTTRSRIVEQFEMCCHATKQ
jgi:hypothetical protein